MTTQNLQSQLYSFPVRVVGQIRFGRKIKVEEACTLCGWCSKACPRGNIIQDGDNLRFGSSYTLCLRCIYGCPCQALSASYLPFIVIKEGFSIADLKAQEPTGVYFDLREIRGLAWGGIRRYLSD